MTEQTKIITVRSTVAPGEADGGHFRAGRFIPFEGIEVALDLGTELSKDERAAAGVINDEDLTGMQRDPRCVVEGYPHIPRRVWEPQELAAAKQRESEAAVRENKRRALLEAARLRGEAVVDGEG